MVPGRYLTSDKGTFGAYTAESRWPTLVQNMVEDLEHELGTVTRGTNRHQQGEVIRGQLVELRAQILGDAAVRAFTEVEVERAQVPLCFNEYLARRGAVHWRDGEWLFLEIYLYRYVNVLFRMQSQWVSFDIFDRIKQSTFESSFHGVVELAIRYQNLSNELSKAKEDESLLQLLFKEFIEISLWGNATDLSLLTNATLEDIKSIQGAQARSDSEQKIVVNDTVAAWDSLWALYKGGSRTVRVDFVLDNSGFELYADLMLAAFLLQTGLASKCIFHAKDIPYMVSDVMLKDFDVLVNDLTDRKFFPCPQDSKESVALNFFAKEITNFMETGQLKFVEDSFWTTDLDYWNIDPSETKYHGKEIHKDLLQSDLVIFKGDLNYRKLAGDRKWDRTTHWTTAIGPLATNGIKSLSLRTCKADVQVALPEGLNEKLTAEWETTNPGKGSWWNSSGKWAVICYSSGKQ